MNVNPLIRQPSPVRAAVRLLLLAALTAAWSLPVLPALSAPAAQHEKKEYLTETEADKIRDAETPSERIKLFISFADDRLKKFQYEQGRTTAQRRRGEILNSLMNAYSGCVDDAADQIAVAEEKQANIHDALQLMQDKGKEFMEVLEKLDKGGPDFDAYKDTLEDAIEATKDAIADAAKAQKEMLPPPVRRKPS
jgi:predicted  nucleic acid-binding Zn-ribbon protein